MTRTHVTVVGYVKSFNPVTGWGFISQDGQPDIFLSRHVLRRYAYAHVDVSPDTLLEGTLVLVDVVDTPRGRHAEQLHRVGGTVHAKRAPDTTIVQARGDWVSGVVKWYGAEHGYGFVTLACGSDAMLHASTLKKYGLKMADALLNHGGWLRVRVSRTGTGLRVSDFDPELLARDDNK
jgi:cold shock CspA family protein